MSKHVFGSTRAVLVTSALAMLISLPARATDTATPTAPPASPASPAATATPAAAAATPTAVAAVEPRSFKVPAGWRKQTVNGDLAYCRKIVTLGSRFAKQQCMSEAELKQFMAISAENLNSMQQRIAICGNGTCTNP